MRVILFPRAAGGFDDFPLRHEHRLRQRFGQSMPLEPEGGRQALWRCPYCRQIWHQQGRQGAWLHLGPAQIEALALTLHIDADGMRHLPGAICPECSVAALGGVFHIEAYYGERGYRLLWETAASPGLLVCAVYTLAPSQAAFTEVLQEALAAPTDLPLASPAQLRRLLEWLALVTEPARDQMEPFSAAHCAALAQRYPPPPETWWWGHAWESQCPPLGPVLLVLGTTFAAGSGPGDPADLLLACWRQIAQGIGAVL